MAYKCRGTLLSRSRGPKQESVDADERTKAGKDTSRYTQNKEKNFLGKLDGESRELALVNEYIVTRNV